LGWNAWECFSAGYKILPYIEQNALYNKFILKSSSSFAANSAPFHVRLSAFICPSAQQAPTASQISWGGPGTNYAWCSGSSPHTGWSANQTNANGMFSTTTGRKMSAVTDGLSNTIMASEILSGDGVANKPTYPYDVFYVGDGPFTSLSNKNFPTQAQIASIGSSAQSGSSGERSNNGTLWAWYGYGQSLLNTTAPPNWRYPTVGGNCCPGGAHDWGWGIFSPRSMHPGGVNAAFGDGSVHFISNTVNLLTFQRLGNRKDGQVLGQF
jgi:prepilin-type processing-associated H-X9-DG protein